MTEALLDLVVQGESDSSHVPSFREVASGLSDRVLAHPFLLDCRAGRVPPERLLGFLAQHGRYSRYFTRYLCALMSRLERGEDVIPLAANLAEELGLGGDDHETPHAVLYQQMLQRFGVDIDGAPVLPETQNLIDTVFMLCQQPGGLSGLGAMCLGAEAIVPPLYSSLVQGFENAGFRREDLTFFLVHIDCDDGHADTMFQLMESLTRGNPSKRLKVIQGGEIAVTARLRFFDALGEL